MVFINKRDTIDESDFIGCTEGFLVFFLSVCRFEYLLDLVQVRRLNEVRGRRAVMEEGRVMEEVEQVLNRMLESNDRARAQKCILYNLLVITAVSAL
jgi:hypothetical protein